MENNKFSLVLGETSELLPLDLGISIEVIVFNDQIEFDNKFQERFYLKFSNITSVKFEKIRNKLWIHFVIKNGTIHLYGNKKNWKTTTARKLIEKLNEVTPIKHMKEYDKYVSCFLWFRFKN